MRLSRLKEFWRGTGTALGVLLLASRSAFSNGVGSTSCACLSGLS
jgi:hypothetical protein